MKGVALFARTTRSVGLTEAGQRFLSRARPAFEELAAAAAHARDLGEDVELTGGGDHDLELVADLGHPPDGVLDPRGEK